MIWLVFAILTVLAILCALWPLSRPSGEVREGEADIAFYRAQIAELEADVQRGLIDPAEAEAERRRAARRLLALDLAAPALPPRTARARRLAALAALAVIPAVAFGVYARVGRPGLSDQPLAARLQPPPPGPSKPETLEASAAALEKHVAEHPEDGSAFERLAPLYQRLRRWDDAVRAREAALRLLGETASRHEAVGEAMIDARDGMVTIEANDHFERALALDPAIAQARYYIGLGAAQDGDRARARAIWTALARQLPANSPIRPTLQDALATLDALDRTGTGPPDRGPPASN
jgi:cytochrome c-type biogenesis protein CcmH